MPAHDVAAEHGSMVGCGRKTHLSVRERASSDKIQETEHSSEWEGHERCGARLCKHMISSALESMDTEDGGRKARRLKIECED